MVVPPLPFYCAEGVFDNFWKLVERWKATFVLTVPTAISAKMQRPIDADVSSLKIVVSGSAPLPVEPLEVALEIGLALHLLPLQAPVAVAIESDEQLLQPLLVALLLRRRLAERAAAAQAQQPGGDRCPAAQVACRSPHRLRLWSAASGSAAPAGLNL